MDINRFWGAVLKQDAVAIRSYFREDAYVNWHCTNEHFTVEEYIGVNCEYPGEWDGKVERVHQSGDLMITATHVYTKDGGLSFHVTSFLSLKDDKIAAMDEYWGDDGEAPKWRQEMHIGCAISRE